MKAFKPNSSSKWLYGLVLLANLVSALLGPIWLFGLTKMCLMPALLLTVWQQQGRPATRYVFALFACWMGDLFLYLSADGIHQAGSVAFEAGIIAFLLAHLAYIQLAVRAGGRLPSKLTLLFAGTVTLALALLLKIPLPTAIYALTVLILIYTLGSVDFGVHSSAAEVEVAPSTAGPRRSVLLGAIAFALSDALIGAQLEGLLPALALPATVPIMLLYGMGQWGLAGLATVGKPYRVAAESVHRD